MFETTRSEQPVLDLFGVGLGPFNLGLAALFEPVRKAKGMTGRFADRSDGFRWHPGMLLPGTTLQVPFMADLVTMVDPTSPYGFLNYLKEHDRLFRFYFYESFHIPRIEFDHYCRWVASQLETCQFGVEVERVLYDADERAFSIQTSEGSFWARNLVVGTGSVPFVPSCFEGLDGKRVFHTAHFAERVSGIADCQDIAVVGSGQSAAEALLELARSRRPGQRIHWLTRSSGFLPMEYSKLGLSQFFSPEYLSFFHGLPQKLKDELLPGQGLLYKGISASTIAEIYDLLYEETACGKPQEIFLYPWQDITGCDAGAKLTLRCRHTMTGEEAALEVDAAVLGTGYHQPFPEFLRDLPLDLDGKERLVVREDHRIAWRHENEATIYAQNIEIHSHGVGTPDLGLCAYRNARILNHMIGETVYRLPERTVFHDYRLSRGGDR